MTTAKHNLKLVTKVVAVQDLSGYEQPKAKKLLYLKRGADSASMMTHGLYRVVKNSSCYCLTTTGFRMVKANNAAIDLEYHAAHPAKVSVPPYVEIEAIWDSTPLMSGEDNNILGDNGRLFMQKPELYIPCVEASNPFLAYYGAMLLTPGTRVIFPDTVYPIWSMSIQPNYVQQFLMSEQGGGFYLEYHHDQPHYHHALHGEGYYLLAKWNDDHTKLHLTGFKIPNGYAVYTKKGAIHCDAGLVGEYLVGYTTSEDCSTVLLRTQEDCESMVKIEFKGLPR